MYFSLSLFFWEGLRLTFLILLDGGVFGVLSFVSLVLFLLLRSVVGYRVCEGGRGGGCYIIKDKGGGMIESFTGRGPRNITRYSWG